MSEYFIILNGSQAGPFSKDQLLAQGLTPETLVWTRGLPDWVPASTVADLDDLLRPQPYNPYGDPVPPIAPGQQEGLKQPPYNPYGSQPNPQYNTFGNNPGAPQFPPYNPMPAKQHTNWLTLAIIATVAGALFSCLGMIFGIIGIVNANKANSLYSQGMEEQGDAANATARTMTIIALVITALGIGIIGLGWLGVIPALNPFNFWN